MKKIYIAYGSNMDLFQMARRCPNARLLGTGEIKDYQLLFKGSKTGSYATIESAAGKKVPILLWAITPEHEEALDRYEGFPNFYYKKELLVENVHRIKKSKDKGFTAKGMAYIMHEDRPLGIPTRWYYGILADAYYAFKFDIRILEEGLLHSKT